MIDWARAALVVVVLGALALAPASAVAAWSRPFDLSPPGTLDRLPVQLAIGPSGAATAAFSITDVDTPGSAQAYVVTRSANGGVGAARAITGARQVLALTGAARGAELLTGSSPSGLDCCSAVSAGRLGGGGALTSSQTLVGDLTGATEGRLLTVAHGRMLAAVATEGGVLAAQSGAGGHFGATHRLTGGAQAAQALSAAPLDGENAVLAWTAATGPAGYADPRAIFYALASHRSVSRAHTLLRAPVGHRIDELAVTGRAKRATAAWIDEVFDRRGAVRTQLRAADFAAHPSVRGFPADHGFASGLSLASDPAGAQALVYMTCRADGGCTVRATTRSATSAFRAVTALGPIDAGQTPALSVSPRGRVIVGWIRDGHPVAADGTAAHGRFSAARSLSPTVFAYDITVADGVHGAIAAWTQGTLNPSIVAAFAP